MNCQIEAQQLNFAVYNIVVGGVRLEGFRVVSRWETFVKYENDKNEFIITQEIPPHLPEILANFSSEYDFALRNNFPVLTMSRTLLINHFS